MTGVLFGMLGSLLTMFVISDGLAAISDIWHLRPTPFGYELKLDSGRLPVNLSNGPRRTLGGPHLPYCTDPLKYRRPIDGIQPTSREQYE